MLDNGENKIARKIQLTISFDFECIVCSAIRIAILDDCTLPLVGVHRAFEFTQKFDVKVDQFR